MKYFSTLILTIATAGMMSAASFDVSGNELTFGLFDFSAIAPVHTTVPLNLPTPRTGDVLTFDLLVGGRHGGDPLISLSGTSDFQLGLYGASPANPPGMLNLYHCQIDGCTINFTVADGYFGTATLSLDDPADNGINAYLTIDRFQADGVTPDAYAPEPDTIALSVVGLMVGIYIRGNLKGRVDQAKLDLDKAGAFSKS